MRRLREPPADLVHIEPLQRRHLRQVVRIERMVNPRPWSQGLFVGELSQPAHTRCYLVAREGRRVVGFGGVMLMASEGHVTTLAVHPDRQGRSIGTRLLLELVIRALELGATELSLEVRVQNESAIGLYRQFGFAPAGVRRAYYGLGQDALMMWVHDADGPELRARLGEIGTRLGRSRPGGDDDEMGRETKP